VCTSFRNRWEKYKRTLQYQTKTLVMIYIGHLKHMHSNIMFLIWVWNTCSYSTMNSRWSHYTAIERVLARHWRFHFIPAISVTLVLLLLEHVYCFSKPLYVWTYVSATYGHSIIYFYNGNMVQHTACSASINYVHTH